MFYSKSLSLFFGIIITIACSNSLSAAWQLPHQFPQEFAPITVLASDANGKAAILTSRFDAGVATVEAFNFNTAVWSELPDGIFSGGSDVITSLDLAMDPSGTALGIWSNAIGEANVGAYTGTSWTTIFNPLTGFVVGDVAVAMNGPNNGVIVFSDDANMIWSAFFNSGTWSLPVVIGSGSSGVDVAFSESGRAVAAWQDGGDVVASLFIDGIWDAPLILNSNSVLNGVGIDAIGKVLVLWENNNQDISVSAFNGSDWLSPHLIGKGNPDIEPVLSMSSRGTAVIAFADPIYNGFSSSYDGSLWSDPIPFSSDPLTSTSTIGLSVNSSGDALVVWATQGNFVKSRRLLLRESLWRPEETIFSGSPFFFDTSASLSDNEVGFASWIVSDGELGTPYASATIRPLPPKNVEVRRCKQSFFRHDVFINIFTFNPSSDLSIEEYRITRDGVLIAIIPPEGPYAFFDYNTCRLNEVVYSITALNIFGEESVPVTVTLEAFVRD